MEKGAHRQPGRNTVTLVRWSRKPSEDPLIKLLLFSILGLILCLISMIFMPGLRNFGAVVFFTIILPAILTVPVVSSQRSYMQELTRTVNDTIAELTGTPNGQLSVRQFRHLVKSGEQLSLLVNGVPGLNLHVGRALTLQKNSPQKWLAVLTVTTPENGTASFDRLLAAAIDARTETPNARQ
jgi:hypothetical protein